MLIGVLAGHQKGVLVLGAVLALCAVFSLLLAPPWVALGTLLGAIVLLESQPDSTWPAVGVHFYKAGGKIGLPAMVFGLAVAAVLFDLVRSGESLRLPGPLTYPLLLLLGAEFMGILNGHFSGGGLGAMVGQIETITFLAVIPFLVVNAVRTRAAVRNFAIAAGILAVTKGVLGMLAWGMGRGMSYGGTTLTYFEPTANWLAVLFLLTLAVTVIHRVPTASWVRWGSLFVFAALLFSFRRSFWIGAILGFVLVLIFATGRRGGRMLLPGLVVFAIAGVLGYAFAGSGNSNNAVVQRGKALSPSAISLNADDRYRIEERRNVLRNVEKRPLFGLGIGVPWTAYRPVSLDFNGARQYVHFVPLWYWMKMGIFGLAAYIWLMATGMYLGFSIWRRHPDGLHRAIGLAAFAGLAGLIVVELTASFTGVDPRFSMLVGAALGWLAAARATMSDPEPEKRIESGLVQPIAAGRRAVTTGLTFARSHKSWRTPLFASVLLAAGALVLVLAVVGIGGG